MFYIYTSIKSVNQIFDDFFFIYPKYYEKILKYECLNIRVNLITNTLIVNEK